MFDTNSTSIHHAVSDANPVSMRAECGTHRGVSMIHLDFIDRHHRHNTDGLHALRRSNLRAGVPC